MGNFATEKVKKFLEQLNLVIPIKTERELLVQVLRQQYAGKVLHEKVLNNMEKLLHQDTYTICTAHQPNVLTGHLYFIYKNNFIISKIFIPRINLLYFFILIF